MEYKIYMHIYIGKSVVNGNISVVNGNIGFPTRSDANGAVQPRKMAKGLKFYI